jgi:hypothetical protein
VHEVDTGTLKHVAVRHFRHPLVGGDQRYRLVAQGKFGHHSQRLGPDVARTMRSSAL